MNPSNSRSRIESHTAKSGAMFSRHNSWGSGRSGSMSGETSGCPPHSPANSGPEMTDHFLATGDCTWGRVMTRPTRSDQAQFTPIV